MTVKEAIEYIISKSKDDESLLTDTKRFWAFLIDLAPEHQKELKVIKRSLDSEFLTLCFKDKEDIKRRVLKMKFRLEDQGLDKNWIDVIIDSFFTPLGWMPPKDEEETSQAQNQQTQYQKTQNQQIQSQQRQNQQIQKQQTQKQQIQSQQAQNQQTQKQQTQNQQIQNQQIQKQQTQKQQTQKQQTQKNQQINPSTGSKKQKIVGYIVIILVVLFVLSIIISNSNNNYNQTNNNYNQTNNNYNQREKIETKEISLANVGDYIKFGNYPQTTEGEEKPVEWLVLSKENNKMLVISRYGLDSKCFDSSSNVWKNSEIRNWLNNDFYNIAFSEQEKKSINLSNLSDVGTSDNVFLLSREEAEKYFSNNADERRCRATEYAVKNGAYVDNDNSCWWLRSPNPNNSSYVYNVYNVGDFDYFSNVPDDDCLVRPALWINLYKESTTTSTSEITNNNYNQREKIETKEISLANVGDYIKFGNYPQTAGGEEKPIEWQVLSKENNKMFVISRYGLDAKRFDSSSNVWSNSEIREWLNGEFYNQAFTDQEKKSINLSNLSDVGTSDNVFLLSKEEAEKYFANADERRCRATEYAVKNGAYVVEYGDYAGYSYWWLRSPYPNSSIHVSRVSSDGYIDGYSRVNRGNFLARPALSINL